MFSSVNMLLDSGFEQLNKISMPLELCDSAGEGDVAAACGLQLLDQATAVGDDDRRVPLLDQILADFQSAAFDASGVELGEDLDDFHVRDCVRRSSESEDV